MAYTTEQLAEVRQAIVDLGLGKRVVSITYQGRTVQYAATDLTKLRALERTIAADLASQSATRRPSRTRQTITSKGL